MWQLSVQLLQSVSQSVSSSRDVCVATVSRAGRTLIEKCDGLRSKGSDSIVVGSCIGRRRWRSQCKLDLYCSEARIQKVLEQNRGEGEKRKEANTVSVTYTSLA